MPRQGRDRHARISGEVLGVFHAPIPVLIIFGALIIAALVWIVGLAFSFIAAPFVAIYEDLFGYNSHHGVHAA